MDTLRFTLIYMRAVMASLDVTPWLVCVWVERVQERADAVHGFKALQHLGACIEYLVLEAEDFAHCFVGDIVR